MGEYQTEREIEFTIKQAVSYAGAVLFGESLKVTWMLGLTNYNFLQGHLSDFALSAQITSVLMIKYGNSKLGRAMSVLAPATAFTIHEFLQPIYKVPSPYTDPIDIVCYFTGSTMAYLGVKALGTKEKRKRIRKFFTFRHKEKVPPLEEILDVVDED